MPSFPCHSVSRRHLRTPCPAEQNPSFPLVTPCVQVTERLLRFLQNPARIDEIEAIKEKRNKRAEFRAEGISLLTTLLQQATTPAAQAYLLSSFMKVRLGRCRLLWFEALSEKW
jgi:uncharacterized protein (DUF1697 family)